ncbi:MAG: formimidoylglutamate deiminase, partial [Acidobacteria bacterium]|nr:formimidoylglutamate deiminase [Acidobacteriota bacterium]
MSDLGDPQRTVIEADWTWTGERFESGLRLEIDGDRITRVSRQLRDPDRRFAGRALLPGFVNAHSHAFQRGLRGRGETFPEDAGSFWTWRRAMYGLVAELDRPRLHRLCLQAFREMLAAGITAVGEFHYLHHDDAGASDFAFDETVLAAAHEAGIRIVLLETFYAHGGPDQPLEGAQRRFRIDDPEVYWRQMDRLAARLDAPTQSLGAVAHSLRAVDPGVVDELYREARRRKLVFHLHAEEQRQEVDAVVAAWGRRPVELLVERLDLGPDLTAVHCTHTPAAHLRAFARAGANACLCPLTEANLGDGLCDLPALLEAGGHLCLGSDSNARISMLEEMRWLEYGQRLKSESRGVLRGPRGEVAPLLLRAATEGGARALGLDAGRLEPGTLADLVLVDLDAPALAGWQPATLAA